MSWQDRDYAREPGPPPIRGAYVSSYGTRPGPTSIVTILIIANVVLFLARSYAPPANIGVPVEVPDHSAPNGVRVVVVNERADATFAYGAMSTGYVLRGQVWRLVTSQYLHASMMHLLLNMLGLYFFGRPLERLWSRQKFLIIYTLAGLLGNLLLMAIGLIGWIHPFAPAVGASGCILGLLGICAVMFPHAEVYVYFLFPLRIRTAAVILAVMYAYNIWRQGANFGGDACHLAGLAFGAWYAWKGERWWVTRGSRLLSRFSGAAATARPASRGSWQQRIDQRQADAKLIDQLLAKVYEGGVLSLTPAERKALTEATERQRQEEEHVGRTDRL